MKKKTLTGKYHTITDKNNVYNIHARFKLIEVRTHEKNK